MFSDIEFRIKVPITPFSNFVAIDQMQVAYDTLLSRPVKTPGKDIHAGLKTSTIAKDGIDHPRIVTLGGDHTIVCIPLQRVSNILTRQPRSFLSFDRFTRYMAQSPSFTSILMSTR
jgi:agmatinase